MGGGRDGGGVRIGKTVLPKLKDKRLEVIVTGMDEKFG